MIRSVLKSSGKMTKKMLGLNCRGGGVRGIFGKLRTNFQHKLFYCGKKLLQNFDFCHQDFSSTPSIEIKTTHFFSTCQLISYTGTMQVSFSTIKTHSGK